MDCIKKYTHKCEKQTKKQVGTLIGTWSESCQFTRYGTGQYYGWHCDSWDKDLTINQMILTHMVR